MHFDETRYYTIGVFLALKRIYDLPMDQAEKLRKACVEYSHKHNIEIRLKGGESGRTGLSTYKFRGSVLSDVCVLSKIIK